MSEEHHYLRVRQITERTGLSKSYVYRAIRQGDLLAVRVGGSVLIPWEEFTAWIEREIRPFQSEGRE